MKNSFLKSIIIFILSFSIILPCFIIGANATQDDFQFVNPFQGKTISVLGDSISTFDGFSSGEASLITNSTISNNKSYYFEGKTEVSALDTWWMQAAQKLNARLLVNNSYSGSRVFNPEYNSQNSGYLKRCINLHDNTGENAGEKPDIVAVYLGTNDLSYGRSTLGSAEDINYSALIKKTSASYTYAKPKTSCEAYAVMLNKIKAAYPDAEIYCFAVLPRFKTTADFSKAIIEFNSSIKDISAYFGAFFVDIYNESGISSDEVISSRYFHDGRIHPSKKGMDAITNTFISTLYKNSKYVNSENHLYNINYTLKDTLINEGKLSNILYGDTFDCSFSKLKYGNLKTTVSMNNEDITDKCVFDNKIHIDTVTGNIEIHAQVEETHRLFFSYRFENRDNILSNIYAGENTGNPTLKTENGVYAFERPVKLYYDIDWSVVFNLTADEIKKYTVLATDTDDGYSLVLDKESCILGFSDKSCIFGIDLSEINIDFNNPHTYKITNKYNINGTNTVSVFIDSKYIGNFNTLLNNGINNTVDSYFNETDFSFNTIGTNNSPVDDSKFNYLQIWESPDIRNHTHIYDYPQEIPASCTLPKHVTSFCDCGAEHNGYIGSPLGHKETKWIIDTKATAVEPGEAHTDCTVCGEVVSTKTLPQLKCAKPKMVYVRNIVDGIKIRWEKTEGADSYRIYRRGAGGSWKYIATTASVTYTDTAIKNKTGNNYRYTVRAVNEAGFSGYESGIYTKYVAAPKMKAVSNTTSGIKITWNGVNGADKYRVYRKNGTGDWKYIKTVKTKYYTDTAVKKYSGRSFKYTVIAVDGKGFSAYEDGLSIKFVAAPHISKAQNTSAGIKLTFNSVNNADSYRIYRKIGSGSWRLIGTTTKTSYYDKTVKKSYGKKYTYTVRAVDSGKMSSYEKGISIQRKR